MERAPGRGARARGAAGAALVLALIGATAAEPGGQWPPWIERYSTRPDGPCHWLNLVPITARVERPGRTAHRFEAAGCASSAECRAQRPAPVLLIDCCTRGPQRGTHASMVLAPLPGDPPAESVLSALFDLGALWRLITGTEYHYDDPGAQAMLRNGHGETAQTWVGPLRRSAVTYNTPTDYVMDIPAEALTHAMDGADAIELSITSHAMHIEGRYPLGEGAGRMMRGCMETRRDAERPPVGMPGEAKGAAIGKADPATAERPPVEMPSEAARV